MWKFENSRTWKPGNTGKSPSPLSFRREMMRSEFHREMPQKSTKCYTSDGLFYNICIKKLNELFEIISMACLCVVLVSFQKEKNICYVPDEQTAVKIALAIWHPIYGDALINKYKPYHAELQKDSVWEVWGTLKGKGIVCGGTPEMTIQKKDGKILKVILGK